MGQRTTRVTPDGYLPRGEALVSGLRPPMAIWQGIAGEACQAHVYAPGPNRTLARWERALGQPHPHRVAPPCERYSTCGGCPWMHLDMAGQAEARLGLIRRAWAEAGIELAPPAVLQACPDGAQGYRHLVKLAVGRSDHGHIRLGAFGRSSRNVVPIPGCLATTPALRRAMVGVAHHVIRLDIWPFEAARRRGVLRYAILRQSRATGQILITIVAARRNPMLADLARALIEQIEGVVGVHLHLNDAPGNAFYALDEHGSVPTLRLEGAGEIEDELAGLRLPIGPADFFQTNPSTAELIVRDVAARLSEGRAVLDLYCGVGGLTLAAARRSGWALGVEGLGSAVTHARAAASLNRLPAEFLSGRVEDLLPELHQRLGGRRPVIIVNPARRGLEPGVGDGIVGLAPEQVLYVSCNPESQARDLAEFLRRGFRLREARAYDMFPHTPHAEVLAVLDGPAGAPAEEGRRPPRRRVVR
ncbi:MAG: 23S rRNA (uracil(1939)-C(5))-methyltransferase RlmD [Pseudomonadota bacterium]